MGSYLEELKVVLLELTEQERYITTICDEVHVPPYKECVYILRPELEAAFDENGVLIKPLRIFHTTQRPYMGIETDLREALWAHGFEVHGSHAGDGHQRVWIVPPKPQN